MANRFFTILIVPERSSKVRRVQVPRMLVSLAGVAAFMVVSMLGAAGANYYWVIDQVRQNRVLTQENNGLREHLSSANAKLESISGQLDRVDLLDRKLRQITRLSDPTRGLAIGPVNEPVAMGGSVDAETGFFVAPPMHEDPERQRLEFQLLDSRLHGLTLEASRQEASLRELSHYYDEQSTRLDETPSIWPVRGWVTSEFGMRDDPYTGARSMHLGVDVSTAEGKSVMAPANGVVTFAGNRGGYGNVIIVDHGFGLKTFFAHLKDILVDVGQQVTRGQNIGNVGNTGRSTGPHLHYEVRVHELPVNPLTYILE